jgi:hypothetical protein
MPLPVMRIAPNPRRFTSKSPPILNVPLAFASACAMMPPGLV